MSDPQETSNLLPTTTKSTNPLQDDSKDPPPPNDWTSEARKRKLRLRSLENLAIPFFYFMLGFGQKLPFVASRQYLRRVLKLSPANQGLILDVIVQIPWSRKMFYVCLSSHEEVFYPSMILFPFSFLLSPPFLLSSHPLILHLSSLLPILTTTLYLPRFHLSKFPPFQIPSFPMFFRFLLFFLSQ
jgi:hypothetical protein